MRNSLLTINFYLSDNIDLLCLMSNNSQMRPNINAGFRWQFPMLEKRTKSPNFALEKRQDYVEMKDIQAFSRFTNTNIRNS